MKRNEPKKSLVKTMLSYVLAQPNACCFDPPACIIRGFDNSQQILKQVQDD
jgi:hypothetical protein